MAERRRTPRGDRLWEQVLEKVRHLQARMREESERRHIAEALGRPVRRTILDADGAVILDFGEPVTYAAAEEARRAGVLDALLQAVDSSEPHRREE
jgi:hypothetical protein